MLQRSRTAFGRLKKLSKRNKIFCVCIIIIVLIQFATIKENDSYDFKKELDFFEENVKFMEALNGTECILPKYDIHDPEIFQYFSHPPSPIFCGNIQPYLVYLDWGGTLHLNQTEVVSYNFTDLKCVYCTVTGTHDNSQVAVYGEDIPIASFPLTIDPPNIRVNCSNEGKRVYIMIHSQIKPLSREKMEINRKIPSHRPSVLILVIDSMSRGNFIRTLPKTYDYLINNLKMTVFEGFNKVADNTYPNMLALLSGFMHKQRDSLPHVPVWNYKINSTIKRNDDLPIIWKIFANFGYVTMYAEEYLLTIFSYNNVGFLYDPVDYYYRFIYVALAEIENIINRTKFRLWVNWAWQYCIANEPSYKYMLNYTEEFLTEMADIKYFALSFFVELSHNELTDVTNMDKDLVEFFRRLFENNKFNNTVVLVMGDHGNRFSDIRRTFIGRIEERMPFVGISLPETLKKSHPHLQKGLDHHTQRLLSFYDLHETLVDLAEDDLGEKPTKFRSQAVGKSILRTFDDKRTCTQIGILPEYCMCDREVEIPKNSEKAMISAMVIVEHINTILKFSKEYVKIGETRKCSRLTLGKISSASMLLKSFSSNPTRTKPTIRVVITTLPSNAMFEATVELRPREVPSVMGDVNRINKYGDQPDCIVHDILRLYCYCI